MRRRAPSSPPRAPVRAGGSTLRGPAEREPARARLRIVGGSLGGRLIELAVRTGSVRPTSDRLREAIASALDARDGIRDRNVLDLFAGSGALAFEALSRGARAAVLVDSDPVVLRAVESNAASLGIADRVRTQLADLLTSSSRAATALKPLAESPFDLVFCDAPYARVAELPPLFAFLFDAGVVAPHALVVVERPANLAPSPPATTLELLRDYRHGSSAAGLFASPSTVLRAGSGQPIAPDGVPSLDR